ncbi:MAG: hypothetical protein ACLSG5_06490 [Oscillospiraceae bacterium]
MDEQKITPKKSEAGIEYIREMRLAGLIKRDIIPADEAVGYEELEKRKTSGWSICDLRNGKGRTAVLRALFRT